MALSFLTASLLTPPQADVSWLGSFTFDWKKLLAAALVLLVGLTLVKISIKIIDKALGRSHLSGRLHAFVRTLVKVALLLVVVVTAASLLGIPVTSFVAVLSVAGLAISLAVQDALSNVAGSLMVLGGKPYTVGDYVQIGDVTGTVQEIGMIATRLTTVDNKLIVIPNGKVTSATIVNFSGQPTRRLDLVFSIPYAADFEQAKALIREPVERHPLVLKDPEPVVRVSELGEWAVKISCLVWAKTSDVTQLRYDLNEQVKAGLDRAGIEIAHQKIDVYLREEKNP